MCIRDSRRTKKQIKSDECPGDRGENGDIRTPSAEEKNGELQSDECPGDRGENGDLRARSAEEQNGELRAMSSARAIEERMGI